MIKIENLTKIYRSKNNDVEALNNVSMILPNKGLICILGKSGSGKSTLLNMIGGLDCPTSGDIKINNMSIVNLTNSKLDKYRNEYVGIIYQDFNLFVDESVKDNILDAARISNITISEKDIYNLCKRLDLESKENVLVKNLSGGQKQRVAIARCLVKNPKIILADEPTGNLDSKTTKMIFNILKDISNERLVIVISHDSKSALEYADRIIYLSDGTVIKDEMRNNKYKEDFSSIELPMERKFTINEIKSINKTLKPYDLKVKKRMEKFIETKTVEDDNEEKMVLGKNKNIFKLVKNMTSKFFKNTRFSFLTTILMITFIIGVLSIAQTFSNFDDSKAILSVANKYDNKSFIMNKAYSYDNNPQDINKRYHIKVNESDIENIYQAGYNGNIYKIYNTPVVTGGKNLNNEMGHVSSNNNLYLGIYTYTSLGTVIVNYDYLDSLFNGVKVVKGSIENTVNSSKLIVTDYYADSLLAIDRVDGNNVYISDDINDPYKNIMDKTILNRYKIGAVIETGYREKYKDLIEEFKRIELEPQNAKNIAKEISKREDTIRFYEELSTSLNFTYSLNQNFYNDYIEETDNLAIWLRNAIVYHNSDYTHYNSNIHIYANTNLEKDTILLDISLYNEWFNKNLTLDDLSEFEEKEIVISNYSIDQETSDIPKHAVRLRVVGISNLGRGCLGYIDRENYKLFAKDSTFIYALMFDNVTEALKVNESAKEIYFYTPINSFSKVFEICNIIDIFSNIFIFIAIILIALELMILLSYNLRVIKKNQYRIGVYKGLGCPFSVFSYSCIINTIILVITTFISSICFVNVASDYVNDILIENFAKFMHTDLVNSFTFVSFDMKNLLLYILVILFVSIISTIIPIIKLKNMKPNLILNKSE